MYSNMQCTVNVPNTWKEQKIARAGQKERYYAFGIFVAVITVLTIGLILFPSFAAADYVSDITDILGSMIDIVGTIFQAVGVILAVYAVGQLILAFKNEDANAKSSASTLIVVGIVLIALPAIIDALNLVDRIGA